MKRSAAGLLLLAASLSAAPAQEPAPPVRQGEALAVRLCAECHAVGETGDSPNAAAARFRNLERRLDLDTFMERLRQGLASGHADMPTFRFSREDARALVAYLRSIQAP